MVHKVNGRTTLIAGNILDDQHWHYVTIKRVGRQVNLTVDSQTVTAICNGEFSHLDLDTQVYFFIGRDGEGNRQGRAQIFFGPYLIGINIGGVFSICGRHLKS